MSSNRTRYGPPCTIVIKLGSSSIVHEKTHQPLLSTLSSVVETVVHLRHQGHKVVLVSSGAIAVGLKCMDLESKPKSLSGKQALAAIGQGRLIALWDNLFSQLGQPIAQVLLTRGDISDRTRYLNAVNTVRELLSMGVVPIVNENDTISVSEIKFGDNDTLSAITSSMIHADYLFLLTDVDGLYTSNPRKDPSAKLIEVVDSISAIRAQVSTTTLGSSLGTGGMETKIIAAEIATAAGVTTIILSSKKPENLFDIIQYHSKHLPKINPASTPRIPNSSGRSSPTPTPTSRPQSRPQSAKPSRPASPEPPLVRPPHTMFTATLLPMRDLKSWTTHTLYPAGSVVIDAGAHHVLSRRESGGRLLAAGVIGVVGAFASGQAVRIVIRRQDSGANSTKARSGEAATETDAANQAARYVRGLDTGAPGTPVVGDGNGSGLATPVDWAAPSAEKGSPEDDLVVVERDYEEDVIEVGRGLANYNSAQILRVKGLNSSQLAQILGYADSEYVVEHVTIRVPRS